LIQKSDKLLWAPVVHTCNTSCSGGSDQEDWIEASSENSLKNPLQKRAGGVAQGVLSSNPSTTKKKKTDKLHTHTNTIDKYMTYRGNKTK
jgi:hypothetical protein